MNIQEKLEAIKPTILDIVARKPYQLMVHELREEPEIKELIEDDLFTPFEVRYAAMDLLDDGLLMLDEYRSLVLRKHV